MSFWWRLPERSRQGCGCYTGRDIGMVSPAAVVLSQEIKLEPYHRADGSGDVTK